MNSFPDVWSVVVAAGRSERFAGELPKQFVPVAGVPVAQWAIDTFRAHPAVAGVTAVVPAAACERPPGWLAELEDSGVLLCPGGATRTESVRAGLETVPANVSLVAVHDGVRPLVTAKMISRVLSEAGPDWGTIAARRVTDTLKEATAEGTVARTVDRAHLWRAETPQVFGRELLIDVYCRAGEEGQHGTDSAGLYERYGIPVRLVEICDPNLKLTSRSDFAIVEALLISRQEGAGR